MSAQTTPTRLTVAEKIEARMLALKDAHRRGEHTHKLFGCPLCG